MKEYTGYRFLKAFGEGSLSISELTEKVGCSYRTSYDKLKELEQNKLVRSEERGKKKVWHLALEPPHAKYALDKSFLEAFSKIPNDGLRITFNQNESVEKISDGSIISLFNKTPPDIVCPHFLEFKWANGCHFNCSWCYLQGTFRHRGKSAYVKDPDKIRDHLFSFLRTKKPEILNAGEICDSLLDPNIYYILKTFENQKRHKLLLVTKSASISPLLKIEDPSNIIVSFTVNSMKVAEKWEKGAPSPENRLDSAQLLHDYGYQIRFRVDPIVPYPDKWENYYKDLIDDIFRRFCPERITLGTLRGLRSTIQNCKDDSWVKYLKEDSGWGLKQKFFTRLTLYSTLLEYLIDKYKYTNVGICKESREMWDFLRPFGIEPENIKCNCTW
jgi:spore photoproduct lyase